jgi:hypothetical protein
MFHCVSILELRRFDHWARNCNCSALHGCQKSTKKETGNLKSIKYSHLTPCISNDPNAGPLFAKKSTLRISNDYARQKHTFSEPVFSPPMDLGFPISLKDQHLVPFCTNVLWI